MLMVAGAIRVVTDQPPTLYNIDPFLNISVAEKLAAALTVAVLLHLYFVAQKAPSFCLACCSQQLLLHTLCY
jgi:hypothetical protein